MKAHNSVIDITVESDGPTTVVETNPEEQFITLYQYDDEDFGDRNHPDIIVLSVEQLRNMVQKLSAHITPDGYILEMVQNVH